MGSPVRVAVTVLGSAAAAAATGGEAATSQKYYCSSKPQNEKNFLVTSETGTWPLRSLFFLTFPSALGMFCFFRAEGTDLSCPLPLRSVTTAEQHRAALPMSSMSPSTCFSFCVTNFSENLPVRII